ncbi:carboxypeptidase-like regulatory domain-containing protein [Sphingobacterium sp. SG20118]|uniref:carboxypeptidase-like regulatory domain-containing protein n=1 Tax=Sphingobacterium sp. SG20118 TaxID=3367156 RepID=UPI0037DFC5BA
MKYVLTSILLSSSLQLFAQNIDISGRITDDSNQPLTGVTVTLNNNAIHLQIDLLGRYTLSGLQPGKYTIKVSHTGYKTQVKTIDLLQPRRIDFRMVSETINIQEVFVTAKESRKLGSGSVIDRKALQVLQPSSFTDILELLPGGRAVDPTLTSNNSINLREANPIGSSAYQTNSLGTQFSVDGNILNNSSMLGSTSQLFATDPNKNRDNTFSGIDMRTISTDNIEKVEIIRGIPSVEYGNLTSGVLLIDRIKGQTPINFRAKVDGTSKLFAIGKGFDFYQKKYKLNFDADYLHSNESPYDIYTNFKRINASIRGEKAWDNAQYSLKWSHAVDINTSLDGDRFDPDTDYATTDNYKATKRNYSLYNKLRWDNLQLTQPLRNIEFSNAINFNNNAISIDKLIQPTSATLLVDALETGSQEASYLTTAYLSHVDVSDKPLSINSKLISNWEMDFGVKHAIKIGGEFNYSKNLGFGQRYDTKLPPNPGISVRPRSFKDIPAYSNISTFAEDHFTIGTGAIRFENSLGVRAFSLLNLDNRYALSGKINLDPRWNGRLHLPELSIQGKPLTWSIGGGYGKQTLSPTLAYLYPAMVYKDLPELTYYHNNPEYRLAWAYTETFDPTNYQLKNASTQKWEVSADLAFNDNRFTVTYFRDRMDNGFGGATTAARLAYTKYDNSSIDPNTLDHKPDISEFTGTAQAQYETYQRYDNATSTNKEGVEYQFTSRRISGLNTRFTINGAWFRTINSNSLPIAENISSAAITEGKIKQYYAIYTNTEGFLREAFNSNLIIDSYLPKLGLNLMLSAQNIWFKKSKTLEKSDLPVGYYDIDQQYHTYTEADRTDAALRYFDKKEDPIIYRMNTVPIDLQINFKATKHIKDKLRIAMFVNRLWTYTPTYKQYGVIIQRKNFTSPYFGMELNLTL